MLRSTEMNRFVSQFVAIAMLVAVQPLAARGENGIQLRVPQSFANAGDDDANDHVANHQDSQAVDEVEIVHERYPDGKVKIERQVTLDAKGNYVNHGPWKLHSPSDVIVAEGQYDMGQRVGRWTRWLGRDDAKLFGQPPFNQFKPPFASQATFTAGVMDGEWLLVDSDNKKMLQISLTEGKRNGLVLTFLPDGKTFSQSSFDHGVPVGDVLEADAKTGELKRVATFIDGRRIVTKTAYYPRKNRRAEQRKKSEEMYLAATTVEKTPDNFWNVTLAEYQSQGKDLRHGPSKVWFENGRLQAEGFYQQDKRAGTFTYWYANGQMAATGEFADDLPSDVWVWWHENGQKAAIGNYDAGRLVDDWRWWNEDGKLAQSRTYNGTEATAANPQQVLELGRAPAEKHVAARQTSGEKPR